MTASSSPLLRVLLVVPNDVTRAGLKVVLTADGRFCVVGETRHHGVALADHLQPDLIVFDPTAEDAIAVDHIRGLAAAASGARLCVWTHVADPQVCLHAIHSGAHGYLLNTYREANRGSLCEALMLVATFGAIVIDPCMAEYVRTVSGAWLILSQPLVAANFSQREHEILFLLATGATDKEIAAQLGIQPTTVGTHVNRLNAKLGASTRTQAVALALRYGLIPD